MKTLLSPIAASVVVVLVAFALPSFASAACTSPSGAAGSLNWNTGSTQFQYCDGTTWQNFGVASSFGAGAVGAPGWAVTADTDTGLWEPAANTLSVSAGGVEVERWNTMASGVNFLSITPGAAGTPATVTIGAAGGSTNVNIAITPKGTGYTLLSGNVGIGTTSPVWALDVNGYIATRGASNNGFVAYDMANSNYTILYRSSNKTYLWDNTGSQRFTLDNTTGNIGIGSTSPSYKLDVLGAAGSYAGRFVSSDGTAAYLIGGNNFATSMNASTTAGSTYTIYASASGGGSIGLYSTASNGTGSGFLASNSSTNYSCWIGTGSYSIQCNGPTSGISDGRLKKDIRPLEANEGLSAIMKLEPVHYRWKDERMNKAHPEGEIGFVAQSVEAVLPMLVSESPQPKDAPIKLDGGKQKALQYERLVAPLVKAVQELKHDNDNLRRDFEAYRAAHP